MHPLSWFTDRLHKTIKRIRYDKPTQEYKTSYHPLTNEATCQYHFELQGKDIEYKDKVTIHRAPKSDCTACEG